MAPVVARVCSLVHSCHRETETRERRSRGMLCCAPEAEEASLFTGRFMETLHRCGALREEDLTDGAFQTSLTTVFQDGLV